jgi:hypothetical protein
LFDSFFLEDDIKVSKTLDLIVLLVNIYNKVDQTTDDLANRAGKVDINGVI